MPKTTEDRLIDAYALRGNLTVNEFIAWSTLGRTKFYAEVNAGRITLRKIGTKSVVTMPDALAWLRGLPATAETKAA